MTLAARITLTVTTALAALFVGTVAFQSNSRAETAVEAYPPIGKIVEVEGVPVHAYIRGTGPDLVLLHGAGGNLRDFTFDTVWRLADRYRVIAFDRPGFGYTGHPPDVAEPYAESPREQARFLQKAADRLGVSNPIVLGHSFGGSVAMAWALERPEDTAALVILSGATMPWPGGLGALYSINSSKLGGAVVVPLISAFATRGMAENVLESIFTPQPVPRGYFDYFGVPLSLRRDTLVTNARQVNSLRPHIVEMSAHYGELDMPVEIVHGTSDEIVPPDIHAIPLSETLPNAELTLLEDVGHMPHHAMPQTVSGLIDRAARRAGLR